jgi:hypothetical protein
MGLLFASFGAQAQITGSKHDFTTGGGAQGAPGGTEEICVYCHTPHGAAQGAPVPLWNKVLGTQTAYTRYSSLSLPSFDSEEAPVGSVSLACLSCHDGTQAMDVVLNAPGSGGYSATGSQIGGGILAMVGEPIPNLGTDLSNDHPISMQYAAGGASSTDPDTQYTGLLGDPDFVKPWKATINTNAIWWIDTPGGTADVREKTDLMLYTRTLNSVVQPFVECGSCHDPHNSSTGGAGSIEFLRVVNTDSQVCTACHVK